jgi:hypothetical protein
MDATRSISAATHLGAEQSSCNQHGSSKLRVSIMNRFAGRKKRGPLHHSNLLPRTLAGVILAHMPTMTILGVSKTI